MQYENDIQCKYCELSFATVNQVWQHIWAVHSKQATADKYPVMPPLQATAAEPPAEPSDQRWFDSLYANYLNICREQNVHPMGYGFWLESYAIALETANEHSRRQLDEARDRIAQVEAALRPFAITVHVDEDNHCLYCGKSQPEPGETVRNIPANQRYEDHFDSCVWARVAAALSSREDKS